ncbi:MAG: class II aldolase/adducin family protein [Dongiaceae bacterium]
METASLTTLHRHGRPACSPAEWQTRIELAALYRATAHYSMSDLANGAIGARIAGEPDQYLTHPYGLYWEEMRASDLVKINRDGKPVEADSAWLNDGAVNLCTWIFGARPDVNFFVHGHDIEVMAVGSIEDGLMPLNQPAVYLGHLMTYIEYEFDEDEAYGEHFTKSLGRHQIVVSRNHGYYALGDTPAAAFFRAYFLKQTCAAQIATLSMGRAPHLLDPQKVARYRDQMYASEHYHYDGKTEWPGLIRLLDRTQPDYKE